MTLDKQIEISFDKQKPMQQIIISILPFVASILFIIFLAIKHDVILNSPLLKIGMPLGCLFFWAMLNYENVKKITSENHGIIIDTNGITDRTGIFNTQYIEWKDIFHIDMNKFTKTGLITITLKGPSDYLPKETMKAKPQGSNFSFDYDRIEIVMSLYGLKYEPSEVKELILNAFETYKVTA
jgi:hypothetical protein